MKRDKISVFISYSHDSENHRENVLSLSDRLITEGIDCEIDRYVEGESPEKGWPIWMEEKLKLSDYVLIVCSEDYLKKCEGKVPRGVGLGVIFESVLLLEQIYENGFVNKKFIPIVIESSDAQFVPTPLKPFTRYNVAIEDEYKLLYRRLTNQIEIVKPELGDIIILPSAVNLNRKETSELSSENTQDHFEKKVKNTKPIGGKLITRSGSEKTTPGTEVGAQFVMIEDQADLAQSFVRHLDIIPLVNQIAYITDIDTLTNFLQDKNYIRVFWVDINLGLGRENEGLDMIRLIRSLSPKSLIIVYSAYADTKEKCLELGVDKFFMKSPRNFKETLENIRETIVSYLSNIK